MALLELNKVCVDVPVFDAKRKNIRGALLSGLFGGTESSKNQMATIRILNEITFTARDADRIALYGHNGAGKTSLLRLLAGIYSASSGSINIEGKIKSLISLGAGLDPELDGADNIIRLCLMSGLSVKEAKDAQEQLADFSELGDFLKMPVRTYSAGMTLRLLSGTVFLTNADIVLVDEFFGAGDVEFSQKVKNKMEELISSSKIFVFSSHSKELLSSYCNRFLVLANGVAVEVGKKEFIRGNEILKTVCPTCSGSGLVDYSP